MTIDVVGGPQVEAADPAEQIAQLRKHLEVVLAGVKAQEQAINEQKSGADPQDKAEGGK